MSAFRSDTSRAGWTTEADLFNERISGAGVETEIQRADGQVIMSLDKSKTMLGCAELASKGAVVPNGW